MIQSFLARLLVAIALLLSACGRHTNENTTPGTSAMPTNRSTVSQLAVKYRDRIQPGVRDDYPSSVHAMEELLAEWSPLGAPLGDLAEIVGTPPEHQADGLYYIFESGFGGVAWQLWQEEGVITGIRRRRMD